jgi:hypothetical protein
MEITENAHFPSGEAEFIIIQLSGLVLCLISTSTDSEYIKYATHTHTHTHTHTQNFASMPCF